MSPPSLPMPRLPLNGLRVFAVAARLGSFQAAAEALGVTPGAVSRQIQALESLLAGPLFLRLPRRVTLTPDGQFLLDRIEPAFADLDAAFRHLLPAHAPATLILEAMPTFTMHWLLPRLPDFQAAHPEITVTLHTRQGAIDRSQSADLYIRRDPAQFSGLTGTPFLPEHSRLVASPAFLAAHRPETAADILRLPRLSMRSRPDLWPLWHRMCGAEQPADTGAVLALDSTLLAVQAAIAGLGIALIPEFFLQDALADGTLNTISGFPPLASGTYHWLTPAPVLSPSCRVFLRWLTAASAPQPSPHPPSHSVTS